MNISSRQVWRERTVCRARFSPSSKERGACCSGFGFVCLNLNFGDPRRSGLGLSDRHARLHGASERPEKLLYTSFLTQGWVKLALIYLINIKKMFLKMILKKGEKKANFESVGSVLVPVLPQKGDITHHECPLLSDTNSSPFFFLSLIWCFFFFFPFLPRFGSVVLPILFHNFFSNLTILF